MHGDIIQENNLTHTK